MRRRHRGEKVKEYLSQGWPGRGGCLPVSFGMFGMLWGRHAASRISSRSSGHTTMVLKRLTWGAADSRGYALHGRSVRPTHCVWG